MAEPTQQKDNTSYTTTYTNYDNYNSAMQLGFSSNGYSHQGTIRLSPVNANMVGVLPKKGQEQFDHSKEAQLFAFISADNANLILKGIQQLLSGKLDLVRIELYTGTFLCVGYAGDLIETHTASDKLTRVKLVDQSYYIAIEQTRDSGIASISNIFLKKEEVVGLIFGESPTNVTLVVDNALDVFTKFLEGCIDFSTQGYLAASSMAVKIFSGSTQASSQNVRGRVPPSMTTTRTSRVMPKETVKTSIDEFISNNDEGESNEDVPNTPSPRASSKRITPSLNDILPEEADSDFESD